jgi:hypothetical protein
MPIEEHAESLRRKIERYRRYLREGVDVTLAREYLREIAEAEIELEVERITGTGSDRRSQSNRGYSILAMYLFKCKSLHTPWATPEQSTKHERTHPREAVGTRYLLGQFFCTMLTPRRRQAGIAASSPVRRCRFVRCIKCRRRPRKNRCSERISPVFTCRGVARTLTMILKSLHNIAVSTRRTALC